MATEYRRKIGTQIWHFNRQCFRWPNRFDFVVLYDRTHDQQICQDCIALAQHPKRAETAPTEVGAAANIPAQQRKRSVLPR